MKINYLPLLVLSLVLYIATESSLSSQEIDQLNTLRDQWTSMVKSSESYNEHKIIKLTKLQDFRGAFIDSLNNYTKNLSMLNSESAELKSAVESLKSDLTKMSSEWQLSQSTNSEIGFLG